VFIQLATFFLKRAKKIKEIKDDYEIYPGHGELTTLIQEKLNNPYLQ